MIDLHCYKRFFFNFCRFNFFPIQTFLYKPMLKENHKLLPNYPNRCSNIKHKVIFIALYLIYKAQSRGKCKEKG